MMHVYARKTDHHLCEGQIEKYALAITVCHQYASPAWVKVFRIIPKFRILRLTFHRKSAGLKMLNSADNDSFSDLVSVYLKIFDH